MVISDLFIDPRSNYRRDKCQDRLYAFTLDNTDVRVLFIEPETSSDASEPSSQEHAELSAADTTRGEGASETETSRRGSKSAVETEKHTFDSRTVSQASVLEENEDTLYVASAVVEEIVLYLPKRERSAGHLSDLVDGSLLPAERRWQAEPED